MAKRSAAVASCAPALTLVRESALPETCRSMLENGLPLALGMPKAKRHRHEAAVVSMFEGVALEMDREQQKTLTDLESQFAAAIAEHEKSVEHLREAQQRSAQQREARNQKETMQRSAKEKVASAKQTLAKEKDGLLRLEEEKNEIAVRKEMHEEFQRITLQPLQSNQDVDNKEKLIADTLAMLRADNREESLVVAIGFAFRQQPDERSDFSLAAVRMLDDAVAARAGRIDEEMLRVSNDLETQAGVIAAAEPALAAAETASAEILDALCAEENKFMELETHRREAEKIVKSMAIHLKSLQSAVEKQNRQLQRIQVLRSQFANMEEQNSDENQIEVSQDKNTTSEVVQEKQMTSEEKHIISAPEINSADTAIMGGA